MIEFLLYARDVLTVIVLGGIMLWCALHQEFAFFYSLFANSEREASAEEKKVVKSVNKLNGSAAQWVK